MVVVNEKEREGRKIEGMLNEGMGRYEYMYVWGEERGKDRLEIEKDSFEIVDYMICV